MKEDNRTLVSYIGVIFLIFLGYVFYHYLVTIPDQKIKIEAAEKLYNLAKNENNSQELKSCLVAARAGYDANWKTSCQTKYSQCLSIGYTNGYTYCLSIYDPEGDGTWSCTLSPSEATRWDEAMQSDKQNCYKQYPQS